MFQNVLWTQNIQLKFIITFPTDSIKGPGDNRAGKEEWVAIWIHKNFEI